MLTMALMVRECPNNAIYEGGVEWAASDGTTVADDTKHDPISVDIYYIVADNVNGMSGFP